MSLNVVKRVVNLKIFFNIFIDPKIYLNFIFILILSQILSLNFKSQLHMIFFTHLLFNYQFLYFYILFYFYFYFYHYYYYFYFYIIFYFLFFIFFFISSLSSLLLHFPPTPPTFSLSSHTLTSPQSPYSLPSFFFSFSPPYSHVAGSLIFPRFFFFIFLSNTTHSWLPHFLGFPIFLFIFSPQSSISGHTPLISLLPPFFFCYFILFILFFLFSYLFFFQSFPSIFFPFLPPPHLTSKDEPHGPFLFFHLPLISPFFLYSSFSFILFYFIFCFPEKPSTAAGEPLPVGNLPPFISFSHFPIIPIFYYYYYYYYCFFSLFS